MQNVTDIKVKWEKSPAGNDLKSEQYYLNWIKKTGAQGEFTSPEHYCNTVEILNALNMNDLEAFKSLFTSSDYQADDKILLYLSGVPYNPYAHLQMMMRSEKHSILDIAKIYEATECLDWLQNQQISKNKMGAS